MRNVNAIIGGALAGALALGAAPHAFAAACSSGYVTGDVFASVGASKVDVFTPGGTLVCTLSDGSGTAYTTGSSFDSAGNLYVTNFGAGTISKFNNTGGLVASTFMTSGNTPESIVNVATGPFAGSSFVGGPGSATINQFNTSTGALIKSFSVAGGVGGTGGTDWLDFISPTTAIYDGEGTTLRSFNFATNTQNADFATGLQYGYAIRVIPSGGFAGDVLRASSRDAVLLSATGAVLKTYTLPGDGGGDFALNLDPNGTDFWTADPNSDNIWEVNIATGHIDEQFKTGCGANCLFGLAIYGEITTVNPPPPPPTVPEPASVAMLGAGLLGLGLLRRRGLV